MRRSAPTVAKDDRPQVVDVVRWILIGGAVAFAAAGLWIRFRFGAVLLEQVLSSLPGSSGGSGFGDAMLAVELAAWVVVPLAVAAVVAVLIVRRGHRTGRFAGRMSLRSILLPLLAAMLSLGSFLSITGVPQYLYSLTDHRSIEPYYVTPAVSGTPAKPLNLITIYLEGVEDDFSDPAMFGENLLGDLDRATADWSSYRRLEQPAIGGWTMAGIVATQCGIALKSELLQAGFDPNETGQRIPGYLPGAVCLGDLLKRAGYSGTFLGGADTAFAGKDKYFLSHGYQTVLGLAHWKDIGESGADISDWGLSDQRLFRRAADVVDELHESGQPFNLTLLTLDTHEPFATRTSCDAAGREPLAAATTCSIRAVAGFLDHLRASGYLKDTVVMITSDHLRWGAGGVPFRDGHAREGRRALVFRLWSPSPLHLGVARGDQFSVLPTVLEALGFGVPDGRAGLGLSLLGDRPVRGIALALPAEEYAALLAAPSRDFYARLWSG